MKKFVEIVCLIGGIFLLVHTCVDWIVTEMLQTSKEQRYVGWNDILHDSLNANVLIIGSSRAWVQYSPKILDTVLLVNSYNLGIDGGGMNRQIAKYKAYRHYQQTIPTTIIVNVDYFATLNWIEGYQKEQFYPYLWEPYMRELLVEVERFSWTELYLPLVRYGNLLSVLKVGLQKDSLYKGFQARDLLWDGSKYNNFSTFHFSKDERAQDWLTLFIEETKRENIKVIFCYAPIYVGLTHKVDNLQEVYDTFQYYSDKYDIPILDYMWSPISQDTVNFYNATHLNKRGAEVFTLQLAHDLDSLQLL